MKISKLVKVIFHPGRVLGHFSIAVAQVINKINKDHLNTCCSQPDSQC